MSRASAGEAKAVSVHQVLQDLIAVFKYQPSASRIDFDARFEATTDQIQTDPDRLRQVFLNILINALDALNSALPEHPQITLATCNTVGDSGKRMIEVLIQDNGPGIPADHLSRVFDPFFTTKQPGKGTGLGLSVSYMIIERLGGLMSVARSEPDGTAFKVALPLTNGGHGPIEDSPAD